MMAGLFMTVGLAQADHCSISLEVTDGSHKQEAHAQTDPPKTPAAEKRPVYESAADGRLTAKWKVESTAKGPMKDVLVHFYVVRIEKPGQPPPPLDPKAVVIESAQTLDLPPDGKTTAELQFKPPTTGTYLLRVETQGTAEQKGHEHFAAIDVVVK